MKQDTYNTNTLAHLVEQQTDNLCVVGSIPTCDLGIYLFNGEFEHW